MTAATTGAPEPAPTRPRRNETRGWLLALLGVQCVFALILFSSDLARAIPATLWPSPAPALTEPVAPGDQTRRYRPADLPSRAPGTPLTASEDMPARLRFDRSGPADAPVLTLTGTIAEGDADRLAETIAGLAAPPARAILNSPGGSVAEALSIGRNLREAAVDTAMRPTDICLSACPYVLAGGVRREVADGAMVGVHQHYFGENTALPAFLAVSDVQRGQGEVMAYLIEMGIDPAVMGPALLTPPDEIYLLLPEELTEWRLVTGDATPGPAEDPPRP